MARPLLAPLTLVCAITFSCDPSHRVVASHAQAVPALPGALAALPTLPGIAAAPPEEASAARPDEALVGDIAETLALRQTGLAIEELELLARVLVDEARERDLEPRLVLAVVEVESNFDNFAVSPAGAFGLMQILPPTGEELAERLGIPWEGEPTLFDPVVNVTLGVAYLEELLARFGDLPTALTAYNWGPSRISRCLRRGCSLPVSYSRRVLESYEDSPIESDDRGPI